MLPGLHSAHLPPQVQTDHLCFYWSRYGTSKCSRKWRCGCSVGYEGPEYWCCSRSLRSHSDCLHPALSVEPRKSFNFERLQSLKAVLASQHNQPVKLDNQINLKMHSCTPYYIPLQYLRWTGCTNLIERPDSDCHFHTVLAGHFDSPHPHAHVDTSDTKKYRMGVRATGWNLSTLLRSLSTRPSKMNNTVPLVSVKSTSTVSML